MISSVGGGSGTNQNKIYDFEFFIQINGTKYSRMGRVKFVEDGL